MNFNMIRLKSFYIFSVIYVHSHWLSIVSNSANLHLFKFLLVNPFWFPQHLSRITMLVSHLTWPPATPPHLPHHHITALVSHSTWPHATPPHLPRYCVSQSFQASCVLHATLPLKQLHKRHCCCANFCNVPNVFCDGEYSKITLFYV